MDLLPAVKDAVQALDKKFGKKITVLDIRGIADIADYFIITNAGNPNQVQAMVDEVEEALYKHGLKLRHVDGKNNKDWLLMDFSDILVHIFNEESREFYNLERTWRDAIEVKI